MDPLLFSHRLTRRYTSYQIIYYFLNSGISGFATTYLLEKGFSATAIGTILSVASLASFLIQPLLGTLADKTKKFIYPRLIAGFLALTFICMLTIQITHPPLVIFGLLYGVGFLCLNVNVSINNSMCAAYTAAGSPINYGLGIGIGSLSYSFGSLAFGYIIALMGANWLIWIAEILLIVDIVIALGYPKPVSDTNLSDSVKQNQAQNRKNSSSVGLLTFIGKYRLFLLTAIGVMLVMMCHYMAENYLINVFQSIGGNSEHVGIALFIACITAAPIQMLFEKVQKKVNICTLMKLGAFFYIVKALLLIFACRIFHIYCIELMQTITYGFLYPSLFYFTTKAIPMQDKAKGQTVITAMYMLGTSIGGFIGGRSIDVFGLKYMLFFAMIFAACGTLIICLNAGKCIQKNRACLQNTGVY